MLKDTLRELAELFRQHDELAIANGLEVVLSEPDRLPERVLDLFTHGMGGIYDPAVYRDGRLDREASDRWEQLAERLSQGKQRTDS